MRNGRKNVVIIYLLSGAAWRLFLSLETLGGGRAGNRCFKHMHKDAISASKTCCLI